jgi:hypothetical protein
MPDFWLKNLVGLARFELATTGLGNRCSIHLSYSPVTDSLLQQNTVVLSFHFQVQNCAWCGLVSARLSWFVRD